MGSTWMGLNWADKIEPANSCLWFSVGSQAVTCSWFPAGGPADSCPWFPVGGPADSCPWLPISGPVVTCSWFPVGGPAVLGSPSAAWSTPASGSLSVAVSGQRFLFHHQSPASGLALEGFHFCLQHGPRGVLSSPPVSCSGPRLSAWDSLNSQLDVKIQDH